VRDPMEYAQSARRYWRASVPDIILDIQFMGALLRSGEIVQDNFIAFDAFTKDQEPYLEKIVSAAGIEDAHYRGTYKDKRFASSQGKAMVEQSGSTSGPTLSPEDLQRIWRAIPEGYGPYLTSDAPAEVSDASDEDDSRDYRADYQALCEEYEFLQAKAEGLESLANTKEDSIQELLAWIRELESKAERFAGALNQHGIPIPPKPEQ